MRIYTLSQIKDSMVGTIIIKERKIEIKVLSVIHIHVFKYTCNYLSMYFLWEWGELTYFRGLENNTKSTKCVVEQLFINLWIKISDENVCTNIKILIVCRCLRKNTECRVRTQSHVCMYTCVLQCLYINLATKIISLTYMSMRQIEVYFFYFITIICVI